MLGKLILGKFILGKFMKLAPERGGGQKLSPPIFFVPWPHHNHFDPLRHDRRVMRDMPIVAEDQLERMFAWLQGDFLLGLAGSEVQVIEIAGDRLVERRRRRVDQEMMMAGVRLVHARGRNAHVAQAETDG
jgi:hypothetical protein